MKSLNNTHLNFIIEQVPCSLSKTSKHPIIIAYDDFNDIKHISYGCITNKDQAEILVDNESGNACCLKIFRNLKFALQDSANLSYYQSKWLSVELQCMNNNEHLFRGIHQIKHKKSIQRKLIEDEKVILNIKQQLIENCFNSIIHSRLKNEYKFFKLQTDNTLMFETQKIAQLHEDMTWSINQDFMRRAISNTTGHYSCKYIKGVNINYCYLCNKDLSDKSYKHNRHTESNAHIDPVIEAIELACKAVSRNGLKIINKAEYRNVFYGSRK